MFTAYTVDGILCQASRRREHMCNARSAEYSNDEGGACECVGLVAVGAQERRCAQARWSCTASSDVSSEGGWASWEGGWAYVRVRVLM